MNATHKTPAQKARQALKKAGYTTKDVSVTNSNGNVNVVCKSIKACADIEKIEAIAKNQESIGRCEITGEVLCGGNTFVFVEMKYKFVKEIVSIYSNEIDSAITSADKDPGLMVTVYGVTFWKDSTRWNAYCIEDGIENASSYGYTAEHLKKVIAVADAAKIMGCAA